MKIKDFIPPIVPKLLSTFRPQKYGWFGHYTSWQEALNDSSGYDSIAIVEKVKESLLKVKNGEATYERDSVLFDNVEYSWPLLAGLNWIAAQNDGQLNVLDFGGSLGSTYFQNKRFLSSLKKVTWNVIEQELFVKYGKKYFEDTILTFTNGLESYLEQQKPDVVLFSCVLQYLESPYSILKLIFHHTPNFVIIDNMPFLNNEKRITLQKVPPEIYPASYPCWLLNKHEFLSAFGHHYEIVADFKSTLSIKVDSKTIPYEGFIFRKKLIR